MNTDKPQPKFKVGDRVSYIPHNGKPTLQTVEGMTWLKFAKLWSYSFVGKSTPVTENWLTKAEAEATP